MAKVEVSFSIAGHFTADVGEQGELCDVEALVKIAENEVARVLIPCENVVLHTVMEVK